MATRPASVPAKRNTTDVYDLVVMAQPNSVSIYLRFLNLSTGQTIYNGDLNTLNTRLPAPSALLHVHTGVGLASDGAPEATARCDVYRLDLDSVGGGLYAPPIAQPVLHLVTSGAIGAGAAVQTDHGRVHLAVTALRRQALVGVAWRVPPPQARRLEFSQAVY